MLDLLRHDLRFALRQLRRNPGFAIAAVLTLALGIGANVAIFAVVDAVLLRPLDYPDSGRIVSIEHHAPGIDLPDLPNSDGTLRFYRAEAPFLSAVAAFDLQSVNLAARGEPARVVTARVTPNLLRVLEVQPALGRAFNEADAARGAAPVAILTHDVWVSRFGADRSVLGRSVRLDGRSAEIVGVMPRGFVFPDPSTALLRPLYVDPNGPFGSFRLQGIARLAPGVGLADARRRLAELETRMPSYLQDRNLTPGFMKKAGWSATLQPLRDRIVGDVASALWIILGTVGFVLLIACANVANLFLVRAESRQGEVAIRAALGAGRGRLATLFLSESALLGLGGGVVGVGLAQAGLKLLLALGPGSLPRLHGVALDARVLAFAALLSVLAALAFGAIPLRRILGGVFVRPLRVGGRGGTDGRERHRARAGMVIGQLALALVLLVGSGIMVRSFIQLRSADIGFDPGNVLSVGMSVGSAESLPEAARFYQRIADRVAALPGVDKVGVSTAVPLGASTWNGGSLQVEGQPAGDDALPKVAMYKAVGPGYFEAMGMTLQGGRAERPSDWQDGVPVVWVNETFARRILGGHALGRRIRWGGARDTTWATVVGVLKDARELRLTEPPPSLAYLPLVAGRWGFPQLDVAYVAVKTAGDPTALSGPIRHIIHQADATVPVTMTSTMVQVVSHAMRRTSFAVALLGIAAVIALFLGAIGLFGVVSYVVSRRTREIGIRMALGAEGRDIQGLVLRQAAVVGAFGVTLGLLGAIGLTRLMSSIVYGVSTVDPVSFVAAPVVLLAIVTLATWLPARRAARVDPVHALKEE